MRGKKGRSENQGLRLLSPQIVKKGEEGSSPRRERRDLTKSGSTTTVLE